MPKDGKGRGRVNYYGIDSKSVFDKLAAGSKIVVCDFDTMRMLDCGSMTVSAIQSLMGKVNAKFYEGKAVE